MNAQLNPVLVSDMRNEPRWGEAVLKGPVLPLVDSIQDYNGCDRLEALSRTAFHVERLWDAGIVLVPSGSYLRARLGLLLIALALGWLLGNLDPIRWDLPYFE